MRVVLWHFPISHFNEKVRWALDYKGIPHVRRALGPSYLPRALWATRQPRLPILFLDDRAIADSTRIIAALEDLRPDPALYPRDESECERALALEDWLDENLGPAVRAAIIGELFSTDPAGAIATLTTGMPAAAGRILNAAVPAFRAYYQWRHAITPATAAAGCATIAAALDRIERELQPSGHLVGDGFTVADLTAAALLSPFVQPPELQYQSTHPLPPALARYRDTLADRPGFRWAAGMYHRYRGSSAEVAA